MDDLEEEMRKWAKENISEFAPSKESTAKSSSQRMSYTVPNPHNVPIHDQKGKNNCTSHAFSSMFEYKLSDHFGELILIDVDDLWEKQLKYGTATEEEGDDFLGVAFIADKYGMKFETESGIQGILKPCEGIEITSRPKKEKKRYGAANINSENISDTTVTAISKQEYLYSMASLVFSFLIILSGILLILLNIFGAIDFEIEVLGLKSSLLNASPGVFLIVIGLVFSYINRPRVKVK